MHATERTKNVFNWLRGRLWLIPALMSAGALTLAYGLLVPGAELAVGLPKTWWLYSGDAETARNLLSTLLSGIITMTSLVVSITVVVLSLAANQLGPRLIWNFIEDRGIQTVIGIFVATILYTLVVLRSVGNQLGAEAVPHLAVTIASVLSVACLFALLFHVNKIARSIVSDTVVREVADALDEFVQQLATHRPASDAEGREPASYPHCRTVSLGRSGYVQVVDYEALTELARTQDMLVVMHIRAGHFILRGTNHLEVRSRGPVSEECLEAIGQSIIVGAGRTPTQDIEYSLRQLVEIAVRALSPGLNDPFTANAVIDRLAAALEIVGQRSLAPNEYRDGDGHLRVIASGSDFAGLLDAAFNQIRQAAGSHPSVLIQLGRRLSDLLLVSVSASQTEAIRRHLTMLERAARAIPEPEDRDDLMRVIASAAGDGDTKRQVDGVR